MNIFYIMTPFFFFFGFVFLSMSLFFCSLKMSLFIFWSFFNSSLIFSFPFYLDFLSCFFISKVFFISGSIMYYSQFYMVMENYKIRFFFLMFFFVMSMIFLVLSPNIFCMLLGWDGLGLVSYCLVIYYQNFSSFCSGMITGLVNRIGDVLILGSISLYFSMGDWNYIMHLKSNYMLCEISLYLFFFSAFTKSAQIPFSSWLPAAMAAPTPVSSLVHSSTLVTAGVYILIRFHWFFSYEMNCILMFISLMTMIMSGFMGFFEYDLKKIIAFSTLSQLGFMMFSISLSLTDLAFFHLITHAGFKALLFMCAGIFIHSFFNNQDIRMFGMLSNDYSLSLCFFNIGNLSLCGFPFLSGFFSKDLILESMLMKELNFFYIFLMTLGTFLTVLYSFRLFYYLTFKNSYFFFSVMTHFKFISINKSNIFLFFSSIMMGLFLSNLIYLPYSYICLPMALKIYVILIFFFSFSFCKIIISYFMKVFNLLIFFFSNMWFLLFLKTDFLKLYMFFFSYISLKSLVGYIENFFGLKNYYFFSFLSSTLLGKLNISLVHIFFFFIFYIFNSMFMF